MPSALLRHTEPAAFRAQCAFRTDIYLKARFIVSLNYHTLGSCCCSPRPPEESCSFKLDQRRTCACSCRLRQSSNVTAGSMHPSHGKALSKQVHRRCIVRHRARCSDADVACGARACASSRTSRPAAGAAPCARLTTVHCTSARTVGIIVDPPSCNADLRTSRLTIVVVASCGGGATPVLLRA
jgi:hypothetical protein